MRLRIVMVALLTLVVGTGVRAAEADDGLLFLENKYVKLFINNSPNETGRFAMDVAAGDPNRTDDDNRPLIYGHPKPWTSYTTIRINDRNYVYGKATKKRPGAKLPDGEIVIPPKVENNRIVMSCKYGAVTVDQLLEITRSPSTGAMDTARIRYLIYNNGEKPVDVGLRTVFDTLVGTNDGAPFRVGSKEIVGETELEQKEFPDFWQAFDSLDKPSVIAQGTLRGGDVTTPDKLIFTNWGKAADHPWEIPVESGSQFIRVGEDELDSVVAMLWSPRTIQPGASQAITIYYGLGGVTFSPGNTFLGISAPADVQDLGTETRNYTVVLYMEHRGEAKAKNVAVNLDLPAGLALVSGESQVKLAELEPGVTKQIAWEIKPDGIYYGDASFQLRVTGEGLESNQVNRRINISGPLALGATLALSKLKVVANQWEPCPFPVRLTLKNLDGLTAHGLTASLVEDSGVSIAAGEQSLKYLNDIEPGKETTVGWLLNPERGAKNGKFKIKVSGSNVIPLDIPGTISIPALSTELGFTDPGPVGKGQVFAVDLEAANLYDCKAFSLDIRYNPAQLRLVYLSRGTFLVEDETLSEWSGGENRFKEGQVLKVTGKRSAVFNGDSTSLFRLNFMVIGNGETTIDAVNLVLQDAQGNKLPCKLTPIKLQITEEKQ